MIGGLLVTVNTNYFCEVSFVSVILTMIVWALTSSINFGNIVRLVLLKVIKLGWLPVIESITVETLVNAP